jgi:hypothetical protein
MEISNLGSQTSNPVFSGAKKAESVRDIAPKADNAVKDTEVKQVQQVKDAQKGEQARLDTVIKAANTFKNVYAVSDTKFTIFKDSSGQFVTRFTSLKDGSVTYIPEPDIQRFIDTNNARKNSAIEIQA